jgi:hypothetical protein
MARACSELTGGERRHAVPGRACPGAPRPRPGPGRRGADSGTRAAGRCGRRRCRRPASRVTRSSPSSSGHDGWHWSATWSSSAARPARPTTSRKTASWPCAPAGTACTGSSSPGRTCSRSRRGACGARGSCKSADPAELLHPAGGGLLHQPAEAGVLPGESRADAVLAGAAAVA